MSLAAIIKKTLYKSPRILDFALKHFNPTRLEHFSQKRALAAFRRAANSVPAYGDVLREAGVAVDKIVTFADFKKHVPYIDKKSYVLPHQNDVERLCVDGNLRDVALVMTSSGHSGTPTYWFRSKSEIEAVALGYNYGFRKYFRYHKRHTLVLNCLYIGIYIAGFRFAQAVSNIGRRDTILANPGIDFEMAMRVLHKLHNHCEQILLVGFPPFIKALIEKAIAEGIPLDKKIVHVATGGESITEAYRTYLAGMLNIDIDRPETGTILSNFGAADVDLNMFFETPDTIWLRRLAERDDKFRRAVFGDVATLPMFFQYFPLQIYVENEKEEQDGEGGLILTTSNTEATMPLIRYNIHDLGRAIPYEKIMTALKESGNEDGRRFFRLPFVTVVGRASSISFNGVNIYPQYIHDALYTDGEVANRLTGQLHISVKSPDGVEQEIDIELQLKADNQPGEEFRVKCEDMIYAKLSTIGEYREGIEKVFGDGMRPRVVLYAHDDYPYHDPTRIKPNYHVQQ